ncbi:golvesin C-terminal-like domain-containing protein [Thermoflavimicrobium dichotomicum]|uniref:N-acetylmuramoyl-L-alanine amidase n=1 Tax=Thermoflavimicrobium dichotomicum TaxID=46223 RepID=A0A1I3LE36_9BACL|nr:N-acetylmuramoyl-L-alanine amidase [Thermoflavimicrobium dichotomicum]SFI82645.1 N-acetylmuramoyl-L-alanine amidase [Thermoflavimicrobium dichotomicum]
MDFTLTLINSEEGKQVAYQGNQKRISLATFPSTKSNGDYKAPTHMIVHHTAGPNNDPDPAARIRSIYFFHTVTRGWGDIGYNAIIGSDGKIYEGRHGKDGEILTNGVVGAHVYSFNYHTFGVSMMGNYDEAKLPKHMKKPLVNLLAYVASLNQIDPLATRDYIRHHSYQDANVPKVDPNIPTLTGHGLLPRTSTSCPGQDLKAHLPELRRQTAKKLTPKQIIVDNRSTKNVRIGQWNTQAQKSSKYNDGYEYSSEGKGSHQFVWNFRLPVSGTYRVFVWYPDEIGQATNAPYTIYTKNGAVTKEVNQRENGGTWVEIGSYEFAFGLNKIILSNNANGPVIADAIKLEPVSSDDEEEV